MRRTLATFVIGLLSLALLAVGCGQGAPSPAPTSAPAEKGAAQATSAPIQQSQPTAAPAKKVSFPEKGKTITFIIPWAAGGGTDVSGRALVPALEKELGVPVVVVNKDGAGSQVGIQEMIKAKPDGYTIAMTNIPSALTTYLDPKRQSPYTLKDIYPVANFVWDAEAFGVLADSPYKSLKDVIEAAKAKPNTITVGVSGVLNDTHLAVLQLNKAAGVEFKAVPFEGGAQTMTAFLGGHVNSAVQTVANFPSHVKSGKARLLGVMDSQRSPFFPDVPTFEEQGYKIYYASSRGISVPAGTPKEVVDVLAGAVKRALDDPDVKKRMTDLGLGQRFMGPEEYVSYWKEAEADTKPLLEGARN